MFAFLRLFLLAGGLIATASTSALPERLFFDGFEVPTARSDADAARFLTHATFGPTPASIAELRADDLDAWLAAQRAAPITLQRPSVETRIAGLALANPQPGPAYRRIRLEKWWDTAIRAPDQLRQRMAFALSQIMVISDVSGTLFGIAPMVAEYHDLLARNALGNYRTLLGEVSRSPMMAIYLTHYRNPKTDWTYVNGVLTPSAIQPDENYAREVMQLFSVGLIERNRDFSPIRVNGQTVPTYDQALISQTARALTGFSGRCTTGSATIGGITLNRNCGCTGLACQFSVTAFVANPPVFSAGPNLMGAVIHPDGYAPMVCYPRYADSGRSATSVDAYAVLPAPFDRKRLIGGVEVPPSPVACHSGTPSDDRQACVNYCEGQLDTLLDALFVHPNTPPMVARQLIQRFTTSNPSPAYIERVARVFENNGQGERGDLYATIRAVLLDVEAREPSDPNFGKLREPLLKLTGLWRAFDARQGSSGDYVVNTPEVALLQRPLGAPSVFNFYEPDYIPAGELSALGLYAPELQILSEATSVSAADFFYTRVFAGYSTQNPTTTPFSTPFAAHLPPTAIDALPAAPAALIDALDLRLTAGAMSDGMRDALITLLSGPMANADHRRRALSAIHLIVISPEFAAQP
jgi:uncharacterized protein (DUF1800 family)